MTYEPGTADITTTMDAPFPGGPDRRDDAIFADLMRELLRGAGTAINPVSYGPGQRWRLALPGGHVMWITDKELAMVVYRYLLAANVEKAVRWVPKR